MSPHIDPAATTTEVLVKPAPGTVVAPVHVYTDEQQAMMKELLEYAETLLLPESDAYRPWEERWLHLPDTIPRYMRAAKWILADGKKRIKGTLEWRREFKPDLITPDEVKIESETGKIIINGFDKDGRPLVYMRPGRENTETSPRQLRHLVWCLERAKDLMPPGQETLVIIVDYKSTTLRTNPSIGIARKVLAILQNHYVETLGRAIIVNLPRLLSFFYKGISPFLDPITRDKMRFNPDLLELIPASQLDADFQGGEHAFHFDKDKYWDQIVAACGIKPDGTRVDFPPPPTSPPLPLPSSLSPSPSLSLSPFVATAASQPAEQAQVGSGSGSESESDSSSQTQTHQEGGGSRPVSVLGGDAGAVITTDEKLRVSVLSAEVVDEEAETTVKGTQEVAAL